MSPISPFLYLYTTLINYIKKYTWVEAQIFPLSEKKKLNNTLTDNADVTHLAWEGWLRKVQESSGDEKVMHACTNTLKPSEQYLKVNPTQLNQLFSQTLAEKQASSEAGIVDRNACWENQAE